MSLVTLRTRPIGQGLDQVFNDFWKDDLDGFFIHPFASGFKPAVNVVEGKTGFRIDFAVPGFNKNDFRVKLDNGQITISGEHKKDDKSEAEQFTMREFSHQSFSRSFNLPDTVDAGRIQAEYVDGILKVLLPLKEEAKEKAVLEIKVS